MTDGERGAVDRAMSTNNHFGWSLSDTVDDPRLTGLANFRNAFLLQRREQRDELTASAVQDLSVSEETLLASASSSMPDRPVKPYYGRQPSVSQWSDSCFGSEYPSLTSTGTTHRLFISTSIFAIFQLISFIRIVQTVELTDR